MVDRGESVSVLFTEEYTDAITLTDTLLSVIEKDLTENLTVEDTLSYNWILSRDLTETLTIDESETSNEFEKDLNEVLTLTDDLITAEVHILTDTISLTDVVDVKPDRIRLTETIIITEGVENTFATELTETLTLTDALSRGKIFTEALSLSDDLKTNPSAMEMSETLTLANIEYGQRDDTSLYIKDDSDDWILYNDYESFVVIRKQNQMSEFEIVIADIEASDKVYVKEFAQVMFLSGSELILKGRIQKITYETAYTCKITGFGMEVGLLDKEFNELSNTTATWSDSKRAQYTNTSAQTIANELLSSSSNGVSPWVMQPVTTGLFDTDYGDVSMRFEYANRLKCLTSLSEALMNPTYQLPYEWWVTQNIGEGYNTDWFNLAPLGPTIARATVSQETFAISGSSSNATQTFNEKDITNLANKIDILGYGDGINQIHTSTYNASETYSSLASDIAIDAVTITLQDASNFSTSGEIRIMEERITYATKAGNSLIGCTRGANSTTARAHQKGVYVEKYVDITSAESGSSIGTNGLMDYSLINRELLDLPTAESVASKILFERMDPIVFIRVIPDEPMQIAGERQIGDLVTVTDDESAIDGDYRIVGMTYTSNYGDLGMELELSNKTLNFIDQMKSSKEEAERMAKYMQGSTNCYQVMDSENCDTNYNLNLKFYLPPEAIALNRLRLNYKVDSYRVYSSITADESAHTHDIPSLTVNASTTITSTSGSRTPSAVSGVSVWSTYTQPYVHGNDKALCYAWESVVGGPSYYTTRCCILLQNAGIATAFVTPTVETPTTTLTMATNFPLAASYVQAWNTGQTIVGGAQVGWFKYYDSNYACTACSGTTDNLYTHTHGSHTHSIPALIVNGTTTISSTSDAGSAHNHGVDYGISEVASSCSDIAIYIKTSDGGGFTDCTAALEAQYGTLSTTGEQNLDLINYSGLTFSEDNWITVSIRPTGKCRIEGSSYIQVFIKSDGD